MAKINFNGIIINWNPKPIEDAADLAFAKVCKELDLKFREIIQRSGAFPEFPGDIVDTGKLLASQRLELVKRNARYNWGTDYAIYVHEGYTLRNGKEQPGRPWTELAIKEYDPVQKFKDYFKQELEGLS